MSGAEIRKIRKYLNLSQEEFGLELGVSQRAVSSWESDTNEITVSAITKIYNKWEISPNSILLGGTELNLVIDRLLFLSKNNNKEKEIINFIKEYLRKDMELELNRLINSIKGNTFMQKLSETWSGRGERILLVFYYFIEHLKNSNLAIIKKQTLVDLVEKFNIPIKVRAKHFFVIDKKDKENFKEWIIDSFNDLDAENLVNNLSKTKEFIKNEVNYLNRYWI